MLKIVDKLGKLVGILKDDATEPELEKKPVQLKVVKDEDEDEEKKETK